MSIIAPAMLQRNRESQRAVLACPTSDPIVRVDLMTPIVAIIEENAWKQTEAAARESPAKYPARLAVGLSGLFSPLRSRGPFQRRFDRLPYVFQPKPIKQDIGLA